MVSELQRLVDAFGARLGRSIAVDDARLRLLAYNAHTGDVDDARIESVMHRGVSTALVAHVSEQGAAQASDVFTLPPCPRLGITMERVGIPIRYDDALLGYVWLIGSDGPVGDRDVELLREAAAQAAVVLHRGHLGVDVTRSHARELVRDLIAPDQALRTEAGVALVEEEHAVAGPVAVLVAMMGGEEGEPLAEERRLALELVVDRCRRRLPPSRGLALTRPDHALLLTIWPGARSQVIERNAAELAEVLREKLEAELGLGRAACWVGVGGPRPRLTEALSSYEEARRAAEVARITGTLGHVVAHKQLGVYALLGKLTPDQLAEGIHPGLRPLLANPAHRGLVETLRVYLDHAGDAQRAATALHVHRSTLYKRLHRVEQLTGLRLDVGDDRLAVHLGLKTAELHPRSPASTHAPDVVF
ncbi:CdaR family transcriptional regulator [Streptomyces sp. WY228]|uniref:PucR family transcriptional regulator n=1 Tax=Streptomyces sp. WY228 TaxID=2855836 RepID=UPI001C4F5313|nr:helix-turn-helix domain-containing protein [Streptomyces sp. WY228]QXQ99555.1 helix-turn-helix domain-containing protein [Streptomyces sp. WY228]